jgi:hypothetical protein
MITFNHRVTVVPDPEAAARADRALELLGRLVAAVEKLHEPEGMTAAEEAALAAENNALAAGLERADLPNAAPEP